MGLLMSTTALAERVTTDSAKAMAARLTEQSEVRLILKNYIEEHMIQETDYGTIPGTPKPTLLQPGAEKLAEMFNCTPEYDKTACVENWDTNLFHYEFKCRIVHRASQAIVSEGMGSCNSRESRYRWRISKRLCPKCKKETIKKSNFPPRDNPEAEPGFYCHSQIGGCGAQFAAKDPAIVNQELGKVENDDMATQVNTILKMAKKRALVDASICLARRYGFQFTQDLEDMGPDDLPGGSAPKKEEPPKPKDDPKQQPPKTNGDAKPPAQRQQQQTPPPDAGDAWEPDASPIKLETIDGIAAYMEKIGRVWDAKFKEKTSSIIGRKVGLNEALKDLTEVEGMKIIDALKQTIGERDKKAQQPVA